MNSLLRMLCAAAEGTEEPVRTTAELLLSYGIYLAVIVVGVLILMLIKRKQRLPSHTELKKRLVSLSEELQSVVAPPEKEDDSSYNFFRRVGTLLYTADKLIYKTTLLAEKERDGGISNIAMRLEKMKNSLSPYKFNAKAREDDTGLYEAQEQLRLAVAELDTILERDSAASARKTKRRNG